VNAKTGLPMPDEKTIRFVLENVSAADYQFISGVIGLFVDPIHQQALACLREGSMSIHFGEKGQPLVKWLVMKN